jgi:hypothetical protein
LIASVSSWRRIGLARGRLILSPIDEPSRLQHPIVEAADQHHQRLAFVLGEEAEQLDSVASRQGEVHHHDGRGQGLVLAPEALGGDRDDRFVAAILRRMRDEASDRELVVDQEQTPARSRQADAEGKRRLVRGHRHHRASFEPPPARQQGARTGKEFGNGRG